MNKDQLLRRMLLINGVSLSLLIGLYCLLGWLHGDVFTTDTRVWLGFWDFVNKPMTLVIAGTGVYFALENYNLGREKLEVDKKKSEIQELKEQVAERKLQIGSLRTQFKVAVELLKGSLAARDGSRSKFGYYRDKIEEIELQRAEEVFRKEIHKHWRSAQEILEDLSANFPVSEVEEKWLKESSRTLEKLGPDHW